MAEAKQYQLKQKYVTAIQHNGGLLRAYEILAWVYANGGQGRVARDEKSSNVKEELLVGPGDVQMTVADGSWVIRNFDGSFTVRSDEGFKATYERPPVVEGRGLG